MLPIKKCALMAMATRTMTKAIIEAIGDMVWCDCLASSLLSACSSLKRLACEMSRKYRYRM